MLWCATLRQHTRVCLILQNSSQHKGSDAACSFYAYFVLVDDLCRRTALISVGMFLWKVYKVLRPVCMYCTVAARSDLMPRILVPFSVNNNALVSSYRCRTLSSTFTPSSDPIEPQHHGLKHYVLATSSGTLLYTLDTETRLPLSLTEAMFLSCREDNKSTRYI